MVEYRPIVGTPPSQFGSVNLEVGRGPLGHCGGESHAQAESDCESEKHDEGHAATAVIATANTAICGAIGRSLPNDVHHDRQPDTDGNPGQHAAQPCLGAPSVREGRSWRGLRARCGERLLASLGVVSLSWRNRATRIAVNESLVGCSSGCRALEAVDAVLDAAGIQSRSIQNGYWP